MADMFTPSIQLVRDLFEEALDREEPRPLVSVGGWGRSYPPFAALVFETPSAVTIERKASNGLTGPACLHVSFDVECQIWATRSTASEAGELTCRWATLICEEVSKHRLAQGVWESAEPSIDRAGSILKDGAVQSAIDMHIRVRTTHAIPKD